MEVMSAYLYNRLLLSHKGKQNPAIYSTDGSWGEIILREISFSQKIIHPIITGRSWEKNGPIGVERKMSSQRHEIDETLQREVKANKIQLTRRNIF